VTTALYGSITQLFTAAVQLSVSADDWVCICWSHRAIGQWRHQRTIIIQRSATVYNICTW